MSHKNYVVTPVFIQMEATECGAVCLQIILAYYGSYYSASYLRKLCDVSRDGTNLSHMIKAARMLGLESNGYTADLQENGAITKNLSILKEQTFPYIIHWDLNHFVILEGIKDQKLYINDPALGRYQLDYASFLTHFTGIIMTVKPLKNFVKHTRKTTLFSGFIRRFLPYKKVMFYLVIIHVCLIVPHFLLPNLAKIFIDSILLNHQHQWLVSFLWIFVLVSFSELGLVFLQMRAALYLQSKMSVEQTTIFFEKMLQLPSVFFAQRLAGDLSARLESIDGISASVTTTLITAFNLIAILFFWLIIFMLSPLLSVTTFLLSGALFINLCWYARKVSGESLRYQQQSGQLIGEACSTLSMIDTVKTEGLENNFFNKLTGLEHKVLNTRQNLFRKMQWAMVTPIWFFGLNTVCIMSLGTWQVMHDELTIGALVAINMMVGYLYGPLQQLNATLIKLKQIEGDFARQDDILEYPLLLNKTYTSAQSLAASSLNCLSLENVSFGFAHFAPPILTNIDMTLHQGQHTVIIGATGCGKSSLINLINGLYEPWSGSIKLGPFPLTSLSAELINTKIATVSQTIVLFAGTVRDNLTLWNHEIDDEHLLKACEAACIERVLAKRGGLDAYIESEGANFSGGEKQRLEIARALVQNPTFLILDEATSALDSIIETQVIANIKKLSCGVISVAHRLGAQRYADTIIVIDKGVIVEQGHHHELMMKNGRYAQFVRKHP
ncbi:MAG TPA: hypothetical protein DCG13_00085 [Legionellales bacterium]|nr:hypothetical protein [Legionellales bacterium]HCA90258.1 hypothetical protein [Legionellales bacterium]|tara:strand:- start:431 stop:2605 length:2175 start_codon:yes stop_codon:yes gene_type:complete